MATHNCTRHNNHAFCPDADMLNLADSLFSWQSTMYSMVVFGATMVVIFWASVFLYTSFYFTFMPEESITWPIHFQFRSCGSEPGMCSNPSAIIPVLDPVRGSLLVRGQKYRVVVDVDMPESPVNKQLGNASLRPGMFLLHMEMKSQGGETLRQSSRSSMLRYKSQLLHVLSTSLFAPFLLSGLQEEKQEVTIELFSQYEEDPLVPVSEVHIELASRHVELYSAQLRIHAMFSGLRYFMFYYPLSAASVGIGICMVFLSTVVILSWYQFSAPSTLSPMQPMMSAMSYPNHTASVLNGISGPVPSKKLDEDEDMEVEVRGVAMSELEPENKCTKNDDFKPTDPQSKETRETPDHEKSDGDDFEVVNSKEKGVVREEGEAVSAPSTCDEGDSVLRQRIQSVE
ncbi:seipin-like isoform X3 [Eriocheir sinensis]|uniref:seipin-like isoform X3 n=1 Tax=Eriocheir sinensis TaxID=95602 RepID=UPI0021C63460|nr:seipin-like isoform X3 [Eriocheir sinensis]